MDVALGVLNLSGMGLKIGIAVWDLMAGTLAMLFPKMVLELWGGKELPRYNIDNAHASWSGGFAENWWYSEE